MEIILKKHLISSIILFSFSWFWIGGIDTGFVGHPVGDLADHAWGNNWFAASLHAGEFPFWVRENYFPEEKVLWHIDPMGGLFRAIFWYIPGRMAWNLYIICALFFSALLLYGFAYDCHQNRSLALLLALMLQTSAFSSGLIHSGLSEYLNMGWGIALLWALHRQRFWLAGIFLGLCGYQAFSYGIMGGLISLFFVWKSKKKLWRTYLLALLLIAPPLWVGWLSLTHPQAAFSGQQAPGWSYQSLPAIDLFGWFRMGDWVHPNTPAMGNPGILQVHYLGWVILGTCLWGGWKDKAARGWFKKISAVLVLSLGPRLSINRWMPLGGKLFLPLALFYLPCFPFQMVHHPYRMMAFMLPLVLIGVGYGLKRVPIFAQLLLFGLYVTEQLQSPVDYPFLRANVEENVGMEGARLDWPPDFSEPNRQYLLAQLKHHYPVVYGVNIWLPESVRKDAGVQRWLRLLDNPRERSQNRDMPALPIRKIYEENVSDEPSTLDKMGIKWLVVHRKYLSDNEENRLFHQLQKEFGMPLVQSKTQWVFQLTSERDEGVKK